MSTAQKIASQRFLEAMGPMIDNEAKMGQVIQFITLIKDEECPTISDEDFSKLIPAEKMFADIKQMVHTQYKRKYA